MSTRRIADAAGIFIGSAHYIMKALVEKGFLKIDIFCKNSNKRQYLRSLIQKGFWEKSLLTKPFLQRKRQEFIAIRLGNRRVRNL